METIYGPALYLNSTASTALVKSGSGQVFGLVVNSHSSGSLRIWDSASTATLSTLIYNTITPAAGSGIYLNLGGISFGSGLVISRQGTIDYTVVYR